MRPLQLCVLLLITGPTPASIRPLAHVTGAFRKRMGYGDLEKPSMESPEVIPASVILSQLRPAAMPQYEGGLKKVPPSPDLAPLTDANVPAPGINHRRRRQAEAHSGEDYEKAFTEAFDFILSEDTDHCVRRSMCAVGAQPSLAGLHGPDIIRALEKLRENATASWQPYKHAVGIGQQTRSMEACAREYPACTADIEALIAEAVNQLQ